MYKKFLAFSAASAIAFVACSPDNSTAPFEEVSYNSSSSQIVSSSSVQDIKQNSDNSNLQTPGSSSSELSTPQSSSAEYSTPQTFSKNECTVKKLSDNTVEANTVVAGQAATKTTMVFVGDMVEIESSMTYDASLPDSFVEEQCTESKSLATDFDATVTCSKRNITAKMKQPAGGHSIDDIVKSSQATCDAMNIPVNVPDTTVKPPVDNPPVPPQDTSTVAKPSGPAKATCQIIEDTDNLFKMKVVVEDSVTATVEAIFQNGSFTMKEVDEFDSKVAQSSVDQECTDSKAEAADEIKEFEEAGINPNYTIKCEGHVITESLSIQSAKNIMPMIAAPLIGDCDKIQETGVIPDDDE